MMKALVIQRISNLKTNKTPLKLVDLPIPIPEKKEILIKVSVCGVCHTELDEIEGRTPPSRFPMIPGHQVIGRVVDIGPEVSQFKVGDRVGIGWIYSSCNRCHYCQNQKENLCEQFKATGRDEPGGYAEYTKIHEDYAFPIPEIFSDAEAAPLLCAGAIGYRSLMLSGIENGQHLGLTGFGASAHLVLKMVRYKYPDVNVYVFARSEKEQMFAKELGAIWTGKAEDHPPQQLDAIIDTTPVWKPIIEALKNLAPGGRLVVNAIRKETTDKDYLLTLDYTQHLWLEKEIKTVANVTRADIREFLYLASLIPLKPEFQEYPLHHANDALVELKERKIRGAKVLKIE